MKALIFFAAIITIISATYIPKWQACGQSTDSWQPTNVTLDTAPTPNEQDGIHACGVMIDDVVVGDFQLKVSLLGVVIYTTTVQVNQTEVFPGSEYCFEYSVYIPVIAKGNFGAQFELQDNTQSNLGCVSVELTL